MPAASAWSSSASPLAPVQQQGVLLGIAEGPDVAEFTEHEVEAVELVLLDDLAHRRGDPNTDIATGIANRERDQRKETLGVGFAHHHRPIRAEPRLDPIEVSDDAVVGKGPPVLGEGVRIDERDAARVVLSGLLYEWHELTACLWASTGCVLVAGLLSLLLPAEVASSTRSSRRSRAA
jgi:hypothetical protein